MITGTPGSLPLVLTTPTLRVQVPKRWYKVPKAIIGIVLGTEYYLIMDRIGAPSTGDSQTPTPQ